MLRFAFSASVVTLVLAAAPASAAVDQSQAGLVTELVTAALAKEPQLDVVASADVRRQVELEGQKQLAGCSEQASCIAEMAGALGASVVVYGSMGQLDDVIILTLNLFDSTKGQAAGRVVLKETSLRALSDKVEPAAKELMGPFLAAHAGQPRMKLLVLDIDAPKGSTALAPEPAPAKPMSSLMLGGIGALAGGLVLGALGAGALALGEGADKAADDVTLSDAAATAKYGERDAWGASGMTGVALGAAGVVAGAGLVVFSLVQE